MITKIKILTFLLMLTIGICFIPQRSSAQNVSVNFQVFYDDLSPYGTWVVSPDYGYVWLPDAGPDFSPYSTNGYWVFTDDGWMWVSEYSWGWAPFHYGRWYTDPYYGPMWVPDYEWGPGWVTWRRSGDYYGWAPIGPRVSVNIAYSNGYYLPNDRWTYVRDRDFGRRDINNYYVNTTNNVTIINNSTVINNTRVDRTDNVTYNAGPDRAEVEKHVGKSITPVTVRTSNTPGQRINKNEIQLYRPKVEKTGSADHKPAPSKVVDLKDVKSPQQRGNQPAKQQPAQQQRPDQPAKEQPGQQHQQNQPDTKQPAQQQKRNAKQPSRQQPAKQQQRPDQPAKEQPGQQQQKNQPDKQQPTQQQQKNQPDKQQPTQRQQKNQPDKQQPPQQQQKNQPDKQQPPQQQRPDQPAKQNSPESQKANPAAKKSNTKQPRQPKQQRQARPPKNNGQEKPPK